MKLTGKQKSFLRSKAHHLHPIFQIGKNGINDELLKQIGEALEKRELIKISLLQNTDEEAADVASAVEETIDAKAVQIIGRVIVLFKPSSQEKYQRISSQLPAAKKE
ncbi:ribosome assembly RNA-binding protein YhbY [Pisciglobus halotolerans]|uniref:RNA-binding protein n=1 Tax=Pisciglobus halotolerans TaxID=745365 RepID=A0A1I3BWW2_9LACT|nr:ribosome assembly RNA-binding protein YhbY [Pisciglobus halotolerans]SFH66787.1 RNA-binding protein [Pisciglobus halotolerans]